MSVRILGQAEREVPTTTGEIMSSLSLALCNHCRNTGSRSQFTEEVGGLKKFREQSFEYFRIW